MSTKWFISEGFIRTMVGALLLSCLVVLPTRAQQTEPTLKGYRRVWNALIPTHAKLQYAGNMGLLSVGVGWEYGKRDRWETELLLGYVPKYDGDHSHWTLTLKENFIPWTIPLKDKSWAIHPLTCGAYLNTIFGDEFWVKEPDRYPEGYYGFMSRFRLSVFLGEGVTYYLPKAKSVKSVSVFYEVSSCDLYIGSAFGNRYLRPRDYLCLSLGLRVQIL